MDRILSQKDSMSMASLPRDGTRRGYAGGGGTAYGGSTPTAQAYGNTTYRGMAYHGTSSRRMSYCRTVYRGCGVPRDLAKAYCRCCDRSCCLSSSCRSISCGSSSGGTMTRYSQGRRDDKLLRRMDR